MDKKVSAWRIRGCLGPGVKPDMGERIDLQKHGVTPMVHSVATQLFLVDDGPHPNSAAL